MKPSSQHCSSGTPQPVPWVAMHIAGDADDEHDEPVPVDLARARAQLRRLQARGAEPLRNKNRSILEGKFRRGKVTMQDA